MCADLMCACACVCVRVRVCACVACVCVCVCSCVARGMTRRTCTGSQTLLEVAGQSGVRQFVMVTTLLPGKPECADSDTPVAGASYSSAAATAGTAAFFPSASVSSSALTPYEQSMLQAEAAAVHISVALSFLLARALFDAAYL